MADLTNRAATRCNDCGALPDERHDVWCVIETHEDTIASLRHQLTTAEQRGREAGLRAAMDACATVRARKHGDLNAAMGTAREMQYTGAISAAEECEASISALLPAGEVASG